MSKWIKNIIDFWNPVVTFFNDWYGLIGAIILIILICFCFARFKKQINDKSIQEINKNDNRKYISDLYVELGNSHELLRYFVNKNSWFKRLRLNSYLLFNNYLGRLLYKYTGLRIGKRSSKNKVYRNLEGMHKAISQLRDQGIDSNDNLKGFLSHHMYFYKYDLEDLIDAENLINGRVCFVLGEAGSGKTNLMTRLSKVIIEKYKKHCIYINAKTITNGDIEKKFNEFFYTKMLINEHSAQRIRTYLSILSLTTERLFIIIEAINENENPDFIMELVNFINKFSKYKKINFIVTARSEFFKIKYEDCITNNLLVDYKIIKINNSRFSKLTLDRMIFKYSKHYNFSGQISKSVDKMLRKSPIIMRMFFECFENSNKNVNELTRFQLFNYYIEKLKVIYPKTDLWSMLYDIAECMISSGKYDCVRYKDLLNSKKISDTLVYENVLFDKSITIDENKITQEVEDVIAFTYDEMRDFILSKYLIKKYKNKNKELLEFLDNCKKNNSSILEGILRYLYLDFKGEKNNSMAKLILEDYAKGNYIFHDQNDGEFNDLGLDIIFQQYQKLEKFEIEYILSNGFTNYDISLIIINLIKNTLHDLEPNADVFVKELKNKIKDNNYNSNLLSLDKKFYQDIIKQLEGETKVNDVIISLKKWFDQGSGE
jgi:energy-coupling factor transporter ATP-binding protein EcfA2